MADEAVVRIVLSGGGPAEDPALVKSLQQGTASVWAPPSQPIPALELKGLLRSQAEYLRLESEAARRGMSVRDYRRAEVAGGVSPVAGTGTPPPAPAPAAVASPDAGTPPPVPGTAALDDDFLDRRLEREARRAAEQAEDDRRALELQKEFDAQEAEYEREARQERLAARRAELDAAEAAATATVPTEAAATAVVPPPTATTAPAEPAAHTVPRTSPPTDPKEYLAWLEDMPREPGSALEQKIQELRAQLDQGEAPAEESKTLAQRAVELAKQRVEAEELRQLVDAEYAKLKPPKKPSGTEVLLDALQEMRGSLSALGGTFGRVAGIGLDVIARVRRLRARLTEGVGPTTEAAATTSTPPTASDGKGLGSAVTTGTASAATTAAITPATGGATAGAAGATGAAEGAGAAAGAGAAVGLAAMLNPITIAVVAVVGALLAFKAVVDAISDTAKRYEEYDPRIAQASAQAEIRQVMGDMRRARESGEELAEFLTAQSELQEKWEDIKMELMRKIIPVVTAILEVLSLLFGIASRTDVTEIKDPTDIILREGQIDIRSRVVPQF